MILNRYKSEISQLLKPLLFIIIVSTCITCSYSQIVKLNPLKDIQQYKIRFFSKEDGLPIKGALSIKQSSDGYFWFGTYNGIVRFDGVKMYVYPNTEEAKTIWNNGFLSIFEEQSNGLWFGTMQGLYHLKNNAWEIFTAENGLPSQLVETSLKDKNGNFWVGTAKGLCRLVNNTFSTEGIPEVLQNININTIYEDFKGNVWIGTEKNGLFKYSDNNFKQVGLDNSLSNVEINSICMDSHTTIWIGTSDGLFRIKNDSLINRYNEKNGLISNIVKVVFEDTQGIIWIGTEMGLMKLYDNKFSSLISTEKFKSHIVTGIEEDFEGNIWVSTYDFGIYYLKGSKFCTLGKPDGLDADVVYSIIEEKNGSFLVGTKDGVFEYKNKIFTKFQTKLPLPDRSVRDVFRDSKNNLWICTVNGLMLVSNEKNEIFTTKDGLSNNYIRIAYEDLNGNQWFGTESGLNLYKNGQFKSYYRSDGLSNDFILSLFMDSNKNLWIGTRDGLNRLTDNKIYNYSTKDGLSGNSIFKIYEDKNHTVWIGNNGGISCYKDNKFYSITTNPEINSLSSFQFLEDIYGTFWIPGVEGILSIPNDKLLDIVTGNKILSNYIIFKNDDELDGNQCVANSRNCITQKGNLWIASYNGIICINPDSIPFNSIPPVNKIEYVTIDNNELQNPENIILEPGTQRIQIKFTGLSFTSPENVQIKYMLQGFDTCWIKSTSVREAVYTTLPPGKYEFQVISCNNDGIWNREPAVLKIIQKPHFYQTYWFYIICIVIIVLLIWGYVSNRSREMKKRNKELEDIVKLRTAEIEQKREEILAQSENLKAANDELQIKNVELEKLSLVASKTDNSIVIADSLGNIEWINEGFTRLFGYTLQEFIRLKGRNIINASDSAKIGEMIKECITEKKSVVYHVVNTTKNGEKLWIQTTLTPISDAKGKITRLIAIDSDITQIKKAEEEIRLQNEEIQAQAKLIEKTYHELEIKNTQIIDSINYAKLIQDAFLPPVKQIKAFFPDSFIFYKPRDIVSGDFYWLNKINNTLFFALADCTGHGVPGALMSMIGSMLLNNITTSKPDINPADTLMLLNENIKKLFSHGDNAAAITDGMDISIIKIDYQNDELSLSTANQSIYIIKTDYQLIEYEGNKISLGQKYRAKEAIQFSQVSFKISEIKSIYLFSDGIIDQFGGERYKKFGSEQFKNLIIDIESLNMDEQFIKISSVFSEWKGLKKQTDDVSVIGLKIQ